jgi:hypothetical protein
MTGDVQIPTWAATLFCALLGVLVLYVRWSLKTLHDLAQTRLARMEVTVNEIDRRVVRIETILDAGGNSGTNPRAGRVRVLTPPSGLRTP